MFIRLFIKTTDKDKANELVNELLLLINQCNIKSIDTKIEPYWKYDDTIVAEVKLELFKDFDCNDRDRLLNNISNKWVFYGENEALSSNTMPDCKLKHDLEMVNIFFN